MNWLKLKLANIVLAGVLRFLKNQHVHLIDTSRGGLDYFGEGRVIGGKVVRGSGGSVLGISILWLCSGTSDPDYRHFPVEKLRRDSVLGLVIDQA